MQKVTSEFKIWHQAKCFPGAIIIWDNWYGPIEDGINRDFFTNDNRFILLKSFQKQLESRNIEYAVYLVK
jgi:hypothetical protein